MLEKTMRLLAPPAFEHDEDKTRVAGLLHIVLLSEIVMGVVLVPIGALIEGSYPGIIAIFGLLIALAVVLWVGARRGHILSASVVLTLLFFFATIGGVCVVGSIRAPVASGFIATVVVASVLIGHRGTIAYTVLSLAALLALWWAEHAGLLVPYVHERAGFASWLTLSAILLWIAGLLALATRSLDEALGRARRGEQALAQSNRQLRAQIDERVRTEKALQQRTEQLSTLNEIGRVVSALLDVRSTLDAIFQQVQRILPLDTFYVCLYDAETNRLSFPLTFDGGIYYTDEEETVLAEDAYVGSTIKTAKPSLINRSAEELAAMTGPPRPVGDASAVSASLLFAPLQVGQQVIGAISAQSYTLDAYNDEHLELLTVVAHQAAIAIDNARLYDQIRDYADELEARVAERTNDLAAVNKELEAFAYSVSHDLRAPLRAMDGFSRILLDDYALLLPLDAQRYLDMIGDNAQRMGALIEDLLTFSRLGRQELRKQTVSPKELVRQVLEELQTEEGERQVEIVVGDLSPCRADPTLLRQVYANLLSNALKFTRGREGARIEVGCLQKAAEVVYFVRDNGVGFDMRYAGKLFGVFQRLHSEKEYEGTGVGLAIVQRIIHRHGGRVWAEAEVDQGATFCFALEAGSDQ
jgi:signal transduction histidine kinase